MEQKFLDVNELITLIENNKDNIEFCNSTINSMFYLFDQKFKKPVEDETYNYHSLNTFDVNFVTDVIKNNPSMVAEEIWPIIASIYVIRHVGIHASASNIPEFKDFHKHYGKIIFN